MSVYMIDGDLGMVYLCVGMALVFVTTLVTFKQPTNSKVEYIKSVGTGE